MAKPFSCWVERSKPRYRGLESAIVGSGGWIYQFASIRIG